MNAPDKASINSSINGWDLNCHINKGKVQYNLKWKGNLKYHHLIQQSQLAGTDKIRSPASKTDTEHASNSGQKDDVISVTGFDCGLEVESILDLFHDENGQRTFVIKFKGFDQIELFPSKVVNEKIPQMVIEYYEQHFHGKSITA